MKKRLLVLVGLAAALAGVGVGSIQDLCGPFTDVPPPLCPYVLEMYYLGITVGTSPTTYSPNNTVTRGQAAVFVSKGVNQAIARSSRRAALGQWWSTGTDAALGRTPVGIAPGRVVCDGADVWVTDSGLGIVSRVRASDGSLIGTWTGAEGASGVISAMGRIFVTNSVSKPGKLYMIDPTQPPGDVTVVSGALGQDPRLIAFDGSRFWTANEFPASVSIITPAASTPWPVTTVSAGFFAPTGIVFDGRNIWLADGSAGALLRLDANGAILQTVAVGNAARQPTFDGANIWVPRASGSLVVVAASTGTVLSTLNGNALEDSFAAAFDGERILVTNFSGNSVSLWRAADLSPIGSVSTGDLSLPAGVASDGTNFWIALFGPAELARF